MAASPVYAASNFEFPPRAGTLTPVDQEERELAPSVEHAKLVAKLPLAEQRTWLAKAATEGWSKRDLDQELKASQKRGVLSGTADLEGSSGRWSCWRSRPASCGNDTERAHAFDYASLLGNEPPPGDAEGN